MRSVTQTKPACGAFGSAPAAKSVHALIQVKSPPMVACNIDSVKTGAETVAVSFETGVLNRQSLPAQFASPRLAREWETVAAMVRCYCHGRHQPAAELCPECQGLLDYATLRLERCRFGAQKPTCAKCPVHCYQPERREQIKAVMRYAGPRMLWLHPLLSLRHWWDGRRA